MIRVIGLKWVPDFARGLVRDLRVRWALEEAGVPYDMRLISMDEKNSPDYAKLQPFAQVPIIEDGGETLFESGAIVLRIAGKSDKLLPRAQHERDRCIAWMFAALNSIEPHVLNLVQLDISYANEEWAKLRRPSAEDFLRKRLSALAEWLGEKDYLEPTGFSAGDIMMVTVLRILRHTNLVAQYPNLAAYMARCEARPAFTKALAAQMATFENAEAA